MPDTPTQTTDRELWVLAGYLHEAYQQAEPGHRLYAAAQAADEWARERYGVSIELLRQHAEMTEKIRRLESDQERRESEQWVQGVVYDQALEMLQAAEDRAASLADRVMAAEGERDKAQAQVADLLAMMENGAEAMGDATSLLGEQGAEIQRLRGRVSELDAQLRDAEHDLHILGPDYADLMNEHEALKRKTARLADYDHQAEQAETYRRLYAQTLREMEEVQHGE